MNQQQKPHANKGMTCPFLGKDMSKVCHLCPLWVQVRGFNPNTGQEVDRWDCSFSLLPMLTIENSQQQRATGNAVESFRNEMVRLNSAAIAMQSIQDEERRRMIANGVEQHSPR